MGNKLISLVLAACVVLLPVQIYAYGGDGDGDGDQFTQTDIGVGGPPLTFTPPENMEFNIPDSYTNPGNTVAGDSEQLTYKSPTRDIGTAASKWLEPTLNRLAVKYHSTRATIYGALAHAGELAKVHGKLAITGMALIGGAAAIIAATPLAVAALGTTAAAAAATAAVYGGGALVAGALMQGADTYAKGIDKGKSQSDAAKDGLTSGLAKGAIDQAVNMNPAFGTIDQIQKALTGKGVGDQLHEGVTSGPKGGTSNIGFTSMAPIDA